MAIVFYSNPTPYAYIGGQGFVGALFGGAGANPVATMESGDDSALFEVFGGTNARAFIRLKTGILEARSYTINIKITDPDTLEEGTTSTTVVPLSNPYPLTFAERFRRAYRRDIDHQKVVAVVNIEAVYDDRNLMEAYFDEYGIPYSNIFEVDMSHGNSIGTAASYGYWISDLADHMESIGAEAVVISPSMPIVASNFNNLFDVGSQRNISYSSLCGTARVIKAFMQSEGYTEFSDMDALTATEKTIAGRKISGALSLAGIDDSVYGRFCQTFKDTEVTQSEESSGLTVSERSEWLTIINGNLVTAFDGSPNLFDLSLIFGSLDFSFGVDYYSQAWAAVPNWRLCWFADNVPYPNIPSPTVTDVQNMVQSARTQHVFKDNDTWKNVVEVGARGTTLHTGISVGYLEMLSELNIQNVVWGTEGSNPTSLSTVAVSIGKVSEYDPDPVANPLVKFSFDTTLGVPDTASPTYRNFSADFTASTWVANSYNDQTFPITAAFFVENGFANMAQAKSDYDFCNDASPNQVIQPAAGGIYYSLTSFGNYVNHTWIQSGGAALINSYVEPYAGGITYPVPFATRLLQGYCVATSVFASMAKEGTLSPIEIFGDGLAAPFSMQSREGRNVTKIRSRHLLAANADPLIAGSVIGSGIANTSADRLTSANQLTLLDSSDNEAICFLGFGYLNTMTDQVEMCFDLTRSSLLADDDNDDWPTGLVITMVSAGVTSVYNSSTTKNVARGTSQQAHIKRFRVATTDVANGLLDAFTTNAVTWTSTQIGTLGATSVTTALGSHDWSSTTVQFDQTWALTLQSLVGVSNMNCIITDFSGTSNEFIWFDLADHLTYPDLGVTTYDVNDVFMAYEMPEVTIEWDGGGSGTSSRKIPRYYRG